MFKYVPDKMSEHMSDKLSEYLPGGMSEKMSECIVRDQRFTNIRENARNNVLSDGL